MLKITDLYKKYDNVLALDGLNMDIQKGELYGFVGPNGAGKTTTIRIIAGLLHPTRGEVWIDGQRAEKDEKILKSKIGYVPDFFGVYDNLTVMEYLEFYASAYGIYGKERFWIGWSFSRWKNGLWMSYPGECSRDCVLPGR